jgi:mutual gliding-motility protein MglA
VAQIDFTERQLTLKLVYYGPPLSGKTTNLRALHARVEAVNRGRLMTLDTRDDRTLFFDLLPIFFRASGFSFRIKVYTVPGQPIHEATRRVVLSQADGVVFVADSRPDHAAGNREAWDGMTRNLSMLGLERVPCVVQYNKRDLPGAIAMADADRFDQKDRPLLEAVAVKGEGVLPTFFALIEKVWGTLDADLRLAQKFRIDGDTFRTALEAHVGAGVPMADADPQGSGPLPPT